MVAQPYRTFMSVEEYLALDRDSLDVRYEYIDGYAYMMEGGTLDHSTICINVTSLLRRLLRGGLCRIYNSEPKQSRTVFLFYGLAVIRCQAMRTAEP